MEILKRFLKYMPWALAQQLLIVGIFVSLSLVMPVGWAILIAICIFSLLHVPNLFLMVMCFFLEAIFLYCYKDITSLIWIVAAHAVIANWMQLKIPETITHGMRVLYSYYNKYK